MQGRICIKGGRGGGQGGGGGHPDEEEIFFSIDSATQQLQVQIIIVAMDSFLFSL